MNLYLPKSEMGQRVLAGLTQIAAEELTLEVGVFRVKSDPGQQRTYGEIFQSFNQWELPDNPPALKDSGQYRSIGKPFPRLDLPSKVVGEAIYGFDVREPGMLYGAVARSETIEGKSISAITMGLSATLLEEVQIKDGPSRRQSNNLDCLYIILK